MAFPSATWERGQIDISALEKLDFVMKGGAIYKNTLTTDPVTIIE